METSRNRREPAEFVPTGLANTGHVPSVRRAPQARNSTTQQVYRSAPINKLLIRRAFSGVFTRKPPSLLGFLLLGASKNRRERAEFVPTGLANTGHVPSVRRAPQARNSTTQQVYRSAPINKLLIRRAFSGVFPRKPPSLLGFLHILDGAALKSLARPANVANRQNQERTACFR